jgi:hypothetical protein
MCSQVNRRRPFASLECGMSPRSAQRLSDEREIPSSSAASRVLSECFPICRTCSGVNRRCPPGVIRNGIWCRSVQRRSVATETPSWAAAWLIVSAELDVMGVYLFTISYHNIIPFSGDFRSRHRAISGRCGRKYRVGEKRDDAVEYPLRSLNRRRSQVVRQESAKL